MKTRRRCRWPKHRRIGFLLDRDYIETVKARRGCEGPGPHEGPLTFHHKHPEKKVNNVSTLAFLGVGREVLDRELAGCSVLCRRCHDRVEEAKRVPTNSVQETVS